MHSWLSARRRVLQRTVLAQWTCPRAAAGSEEHLSDALGPGDARQGEISSSMASGGAPIRVDIGVKNALQTLLQHEPDVGENGTVDPLIAHLPKLKPEAGKSRTLGLMIEVLLRQAGYSWDSNRVWLTAVPDKKAERRATAGPTTSRPATPRVAMQQLPSNLEHDISNRLGA